MNSRVLALCVLAVLVGMFAASTAVPAVSAASNSFSNDQYVGNINDQEKNSKFDCVLECKKFFD
jgi:hypothetical protein